MPGHVARKASSARIKDPDRNDIVATLIQALEAAENRLPLDQTTLAARAYNKLQFDFPLLEESELDALAEELRNSYQSTKGSGLYSDSYLITTKLVENITQGVLGTATGGPAAHQPPTSDRDAGSSSVQPTAASAEAHVLPKEAHALRGAYQRLCVVVLLQFVSAVLSVPEADAWQLLASYDPQHLEAADDDSLDGEPTQHLAGPAAGEHSILQPQSFQPQDAEQAAAAAHAKYAAVEATEEDGDDYTFEPLEPAPATSAPPSAQLSSKSAHLNGGHMLLPSGIGLGQGVEQQADERWPALHALILHLASPEHLLALDPRITFTATASAPTSAISTSGASTSKQSNGADAAGKDGLEQVQALGAWSDPATLSALLGLISTAGIHARAAELQPLVSACVGLVGERVASHHEDAEAVLGALWEALGVKGLAGMPKGPGARRSKQPVVLPMEAATAFNLVCSLALQGSASAALRGVLWRHTRDHLLPLLERCLADMAAGGAGSANPQTLAGVALTCQVVVLFLENCPGNVDGPKALLSAGVVRCLALLLPIYSSHPGAEPLRLAALLCAAGSQEVRTWMLAVPGVAAAVQGLVQHACAAAHAVVWQLVAPAVAGPLQAPDAMAGAGLQQVLEQGVAANSGEALAHMHAVLQLMARAVRMAGGRLTWGSRAESALRQAAAALRETGSASSGGAAGVANTADAPSTSGKDGVTGPAHDTQCVIREVLPGEGDEDDEVAAKARGHDAGALDSKRAQQLRPACLKLIKQLLTIGGKTD